MATQVKDRQAGKNDAFIESQLALAQFRVRLVDILTAVLGFLGGTIAFAVLMILLDKRFVLSDGVRQFALLVYFAGAMAYLGFTVLQPLRWRVNPHYAARQLEGTLPGTRNHVINWIDLHTEKVPSVLKSTLGQRAAKDLARADIDAAISNRRAFLVGGVAGLLTVILITLFFLFGPAPFASLFGRAFAPFGNAGGIASRTQVVILRPQDTTVTIGNAVTIVAQVGGRVPDARDKDAPCLHYRHDEREPYRKRFLQADESNQEWATTISPIDVRNGFFYKVSAGDAETPEYEVKVRATPLLTNFEAKYRYRRYVGKADRTRTTRKLEDLRGTEVLITAWANRTIKEGMLEFEGDDGAGDLIRTERVDNDPQALRFRMVLDRKGKYRIRFTSTDGESYTDSTSFEVSVFLDNPPQVRLTEPAKDVTLPANGQLEVKGEASDDFGIASMSLQLQLVGGGLLQPKPYLPGKLGTPGFGTPLNVDYRDLLELSSLKHSDGKPLDLKPGTEIEYWLQAGDACDYLRPNVTDSRPRWKIKIGEADKDEARRQKERDQAKAGQKEHEAKQAEKMKKEQADREKKQKEEQAQEDQANGNQQTGKSPDKDPKAENQNNTEKKDTGEKEPGEKSEPKDPGNDPKSDGKSPEGQGQDKKTQEKANELKNALDKQKEKRNDKGDQDKPGEAREADNRPGKGKDKGEKKPGEAEGKDNKPGESRSEGGQDSKNPASSKKEEGGKAGEKGSARGETRPEPGSPKGEAKEQSAKTEAGKQPGESKNCPAPRRAPERRKGTATAIRARVPAKANPRERPNLVIRPSKEKHAIRGVLASQTTRSPARESKERNRPSPVPRGKRSPEVRRAVRVSRVRAKLATRDRVRTSPPVLQVRNRPIKARRRTLARRAMVPARNRTSREANLGRTNPHPAKEPARRAKRKPVMTLFRRRAAPPRKANRTIPARRERSRGLARRIRRETVRRKKAIPRVWARRRAPERRTRPAIILRENVLLATGAAATMA